MFSYDEVQYRIFCSIEVFFFFSVFFYKFVGPELLERPVDFSIRYACGVCKNVL